MPVIYFVDGPADGRKEVTCTSLATGDRWRFPIQKPFDYRQLDFNAELRTEAADYQLTEIEDGVFTGLHVP